MTYEMKSGPDFFEWIKKMQNNNLKTEDNPFQIYQDICRNLNDLRESGFIDSDYYNIFEENLIDNFSKELSVFKTGLENWKSNLSNDILSDIESESNAGDFEFSQEIDKIWHLFIFWGSMYTGEDHPKHPNFITHFNDIQVHQIALELLVKSVPIPSDL
jgi:hypothetical protein